jgi:hypothetical protein
MAKLINSTEELKQYIPVSVALTFADIDPKLRLVEREVIIRKFGKDIFQHVIQPGASEQAEELHSLLAEATAHLGLMHYIGFSHAQINSAGIQIATDDHNKAAFEWQIEAIRDECSSQGWAALESALEYMESLPEGELLDLWKATDTYISSKHTLIPTLRHFQRWASLGNSRVLFNKLLPILRYIEEERIAPAIGQELYNKVIAYAEEEDPAQKARLTTLHRHSSRALAFATIGDGFVDTMLVLSDNGPLVIDAIQSRLSKSKATAPEDLLMAISKKFASQAEGALTDMLAFCQANVDHFPEYKNTVNYIPEDEDRTDHIPRNDPDAGIAFF